MRFFFPHQDGSTRRAKENTDVGLLLPERVNALVSEMDETREKLLETVQETSNFNEKISDQSPLYHIKNALQKLRLETQELDRKLQIKRRLVGAGELRKQETNRLRRAQEQQQQHKKEHHRRNGSDDTEEDVEDDEEEENQVPVEEFAPFSNNQKKERI